MSDKLQFVVCCFKWGLRATSLNDKLKFVGHRSVNLWLARRCARMQKIKVATLICLSHVRGIQRAKAALVSRRFRIPLRAPPGQFVIADTQIKLSLRNIQFDQIAIAHKREGATYE